jgi:hypothetical protein
MKRLIITIRYHMGRLASHALLPLHLATASQHGAELGSRMPKAPRSGLSLTPVSTVIYEAREMKRRMR